MPHDTDGAVLASDTSRAAEDVQVARWRAMSAAEKLRLVSTLSAAVDQLALAGIDHRFPGASARERFLRLAILKLGAHLAARAYPDAAPYVDQA